MEDLTRKIHSLIREYKFTMDQGQVSRGITVSLRIITNILSFFHSLFPPLPSLLPVFPLPPYLFPLLLLFFVFELWPGWVNRKLILTCLEARAATYRCTRSALDNGTSQGVKWGCSPARAPPAELSLAPGGGTFSFSQRCHPSGPYATKGDSDSHTATILTVRNYVTI